MTNSPAPPFALRLFTLAAVVLCGLLLYPLLAGVTWGLAFAVIAWPVHKAIFKAVRSRNIAAAVSTTAMIVAFLVPLVLVSAQLVREARAAKDIAQGQVESGEWRTNLLRVPYVGEPILKELEGTSPEQVAREGLARVGGYVMPVAGGVGAFAFQTLIAAFVLFFAFRDGPSLVKQVQTILPLDPPTAARFTGRAADAVVATLVGTIFTALLQGVTGGLMFYALDLPGAVLWGVVMFVVSVLPVLGAFMVWAPAAAYLASQDRYAAAAALVAWGVIMAGPVGNLLYARLAGGRMGLHPVVSLLAFLGGLAVFGVAGMVLGPVVVVLATELVRLWVGRELLERDSTPEAGAGE